MTNRETILNFKEVKMSDVDKQIDEILEQAFEQHAESIGKAQDQLIVVFPKIADIREQILAVMGNGWISVEELARYQTIEKMALEFVQDSYRPKPKYDAWRFDNLKIALNIKVSESDKADYDCKNPELH